MTTMSMVYCERYGTKMMAGGCEKFRQNTPERCRGCAGPVACGDDVVETVKQQIAAQKTDMQKANKEPREGAMKTCTTDGCTEKTLAKGLCKKHYHQNRDKQRRARAAAKKNMTAPGQELTEERAQVSPPIGAAKKIKEKETMAAPKTQHQSKTVPASARDRRDRADNRIGRIEINFLARDKELLEKLQASAERNRRTLSAEILFRLENSEKKRCYCSDPGMPALGERS